MSEEIKPPEPGSGDTTRFWNKVIKRRTARWLHGLIGAVISGGAATASAQFGLAMGQAIGIAVQVMDLKQLGTVFVASGISGALAYLKQSPLPSIERKIVEGDPTEFITRDKPK